MKVVYLYDGNTKEFTGKYNANDDLVNVGEFITPTNSTDIAPPDEMPAKMIQVWSVEKNEWVMEPDYRGDYWYDQTGNKVKIVAIGQPDSNLSETVPATVVLGNAKVEKMASFYNSYLDAIQQPVSYMDTTFQANDASQQVLTKVLVAGSVAPGFFWVDANNQRVTMTYKNLQGLAAAMLNQGQKAFAHLQDLKEQVRVAATADELSKVVW